VVFWVCFAVSQSVLADPCVKVSSNYLKVEDLQGRVGEFQELDPKQIIGRAPAPGIIRVIRVRELNAFLRAHSTGARQIKDPSASICVERHASVLPAGEILAAVRQAFETAGRQVSVELVEFSKHATGSGKLHFPLVSLPNRTTGASESVIWRGWHVAEDRSRTAVWARVRLAERVPVHTATRDLAAGDSITPEDIERRIEHRFPGLSSQREPEDFTGWTLRRPVRAGAVIGKADIEAPILVRRGDAIELLISGENLGMRVTAKAESTARAGQRVAVTTGLSKKVVQALVQEKGRAVLHVSEAKNAR